MTFSPLRKWTDNQHACTYDLLSETAIAGTGMGAAAVFERGAATDELCNARKVESHGLLSKDAL